jgi:hypothetical protein
MYIGNVVSLECKTIRDLTDHLLPAGRETNSRAFGDGRCYAELKPGSYPVTRRWTNVCVCKLILEKNNCTKMLKSSQQIVINSLPTKGQISLLFPNSKDDGSHFFTIQYTRLCHAFMSEFLKFVSRATHLNLLQFLRLQRRTHVLTLLLSEVSSTQLSRLQHQSIASLLSRRSVNSTRARSGTFHMCM